MTLEFWCRTANDDLELLECVGCALQEKADLADSFTNALLPPIERAVLTLWTYLAANPEWYPMPVSYDEVTESLRLLSLVSTAEKISPDLRSPSEDLAIELLGALAVWVRTHPHQLEIDASLETQHRWLAKTMTPLPLERMSAIYRLKKVKPKPYES